MIYLSKFHWWLFVFCVYLVLISLSFCPSFPPFFPLSLPLGFGLLWIEVLHSCICVLMGIFSEYRNMIDFFIDIQYWNLWELLINVDFCRWVCIFRGMLTASGIITVLFLWSLLFVFLSLIHWLRYLVGCWILVIIIRCLSLFWISKRIFSILHVLSTLGIFIVFFFSKFKNVLHP